jgi:hypothetical protein
MLGSVGRGDMPGNGSSVLKTSKAEFGITSRQELKPAQKKRDRDCIMTSN